MKEAAASRIAGDQCLLFLLFCLFSRTEPELWVLAAFTAACLICGFPAALAQRAWLRLLCTLPPLFLIFLAVALPTRVVLVLAWLYFALSFALDRFGMEYWAYRRSFIVIAAVALIASFWVAAAKTLGVPAPAGVLGFAAGCLVLGVYTLRAIRMGVTTDPGWKAYSALELILPAAAGGVLFGLLFALLRHGEKVFALLIAAPFALLISAITTLFSVFSGYELDDSPSDITEIVPPETFDPPPTGTPASPEKQEALDVSLWLDEHPVPWLGILITLVLIVALVLFVRYLRYSRRAKDEAGSGLREEHFRVFKKRRTKEPARENAARIREIYQSYLVLLQHGGQPIRASDTSEDIFTAPTGHARSEAEQTLRALYLAARYGDGTALRAEDVAAAEDCLRAIREQ